MCERKTITEDELDDVFKKAAKLVIEKNRIKGIPIAGYDVDKKCLYVEQPDGRKVYEQA